jgi:hypothetical protein
VAKRFGLTWRSVLIGIGASVFLGDWSQYAELIIHGTQISLTYPPIGGFLVFMAIYLLFNVILRAVNRRFTLTQPELVVIFTIIVMASGIASIDLAQKLIPMMVGPYYYASAENQYALFFLPHIPDWMAPTDPRVVTALFEGWGLGIPWDAWMLPLAAWTAFTLATYALMLCVVTIFRKQWIDRERLLFPLVAVPLEMTEPAQGRRFLNDFFRNPIVWIGLFLGFAPHFFNGLNAYYPSIPEAEIFRIGGIAVPSAPWGLPWSAVGTLRFQIAPLIIGLSFLLTREVSFSLWAFYWLARVEAVIGTSLGLNGVTTAAGGDGFPFPGHQTAGAYLALAGVSIWIAREPLKRIFVRGLTLAEGPGGGDEPISYRMAVWGGPDCVQLHDRLRDLLAGCRSGGHPAAGRGLRLPPRDDPADVRGWHAVDVRAGLAGARHHAGADALPLHQRGQLGIGRHDDRPSRYDMRVSPMPRIMQSLKLSDETATSSRAITWSITIATHRRDPRLLLGVLGGIHVHGGVAINTYRFVSLARQPGQFMERWRPAGLQEPRLAEPRADHGLRGGSSC